MSSQPHRDDPALSTEPPSAGAERLAAEGYLVVRGVHDRAWLSTIQRTFEALYLQQAMHLRQDASNIDLLTNHSSGAVQLVHHPGDELHAFFGGATKLILAPLLPVVSAYLGEPLVVPIGYLTYRRHRVPNDPAADSTFVGFHQDSNFVGSFPMLNCWICLDDCGRDAPGLELISGRVDLDLRDSLSPVQAPHGIHMPIYDSNQLHALFPDAASVTPVLAVGDILLFHGYTPHRTYMSPGMTRPRSSFEIRVFNAHGLPPMMQTYRPTAVGAE
jgi:ectoine hydroxylase-related dioxygenase (phytanoyl-CoA dioxygenase family)